MAVKVTELPHYSSITPYWDFEHITSLPCTEGVFNCLMVGHGVPNSLGLAEIPYAPLISTTPFVRGNPSRSAVLGITYLATSRSGEQVDLTNPNTAQPFTTACSRFGNPRLVGSNTLTETKQYLHHGRPQLGSSSQIPQLEFDTSLIGSRHPVDIISLFFRTLEPNGIGS